MTPGSSRVRKGIARKKQDAITRLGKSCERVVDTMEAAGGSVELVALAAAIGVKRPRDLIRRRNPVTGKGRDGFVTRLEDVGVLEVADDLTVTLTGDWLEALDRERDRAGEIALYRRDMARYNREREGYRNRDRDPDHHPANVGADGFIEDLETEPPDGDGRRDGDDVVPGSPSPLTDAVGEYLKRSPGDASQPAGWIGSTLWALDLFGGKPSAADVQAAIDELGGEAYLRERLEAARGAA